MSLVQNAKFLISPHLPKSSDPTHHSVIEPNPTQPNLWMDPTHAHLWDDSHAYRTREGGGTATV